MAIYHLHASVCKSSAAAKIDYIFREKKYSQKKAEDLIYRSEYNLPSWAKNSYEFFSEMDKQELSKSEKELGTKNTEKNKRKVKCRTIEFSLPIELSKEKQIELAENYAKKLLGDNHVYALAIHENIGSLSGIENPHVHLVFSDRLLEPNRDVNKEDFCKQRKGYKKDSEINGSKRTEWLIKARELLSDLTNEYAAQFEFKDVSEKSYKEQGIKKEPTEHLGHSTILAVERAAAYQLSKNEIPNIPKFERYIQSKHEQIKQHWQQQYLKVKNDYKPTFIQSIKAAAKWAIYQHTPKQEKELKLIAFKKTYSLLEELKRETDILIKKSQKKLVETVLTNIEAKGWLLKRNHEASFCCYIKNELPAVSSKDLKQIKEIINQIQKEPAPILRPNRPMQPPDPPQPKIEKEPKTALNEQLICQTTQEEEKTLNTPKKSILEPKIKKPTPAISVVKPKIERKPTQSMQPKPKRKEKIKTSNKEIKRERGGFSL